MEEITIFLECPNTEILGVVGKNIHLLTHGFKNDEDSDFDCVLVVSVKEYLKQWKAWLRGKKRYCERYNHYCGVMGTVSAKDPVKTGTQTIFKWNEKTEDMEEVIIPLYIATEFEGEPNFEHG